MRIVFKERMTGQIDFGLLYGAIAAICMLAFRFLPIRQVLPPCIFKSVTGIPCPTCGSTRAVLLLVRGDLVGSFIMNPMLSLILVGTVIWFLLSVSSFVASSATRPVLSLSGREKDILRIVVVLLFLLNWAYVIIAVS